MMDKGTEKLTAKATVSRKTADDIDGYSNPLMFDCEECREQSINGNLPSRFFQWPSPSVSFTERVQIVD